MIENCQFCFRIQNEYDSTNTNNVESLESFLKQHEKVLHPNHYHMVAAKHSLSQLYGKAPGYLIHQMSDSLLERKKEICLHLLNIFDKIEPGYSRLRGKLSSYHLKYSYLTNSG